jgi:outer membrane beta-barrel protein
VSYIATHRPFAWCRAAGLVVAVGLITFCSPSFASFSEGQDSYEKSIDSVIRHKEFYKADHLETTFIAGVMPYSSIINHYMLGGRLTYHFSDHFGWEVADLQFAMPSVTSYTTGLVSSSGISNLQAQEYHFLAASNFLVSPFYGKIRLWGAQVLHFDTYLVAGIGAANASIVEFGTSAVNGAVSTVPQGSEWDPMFDFGLGFKLYLNHEFALVLDLRDYVVDATAYGSKALRSNYTVYVGFSFFIPPLG